MSKYENLKQRIEALDDGWNKEADDLLEEIMDKSDRVRWIELPTTSEGDYIFINDSDDKHLWTSKKINSQCQKMEAFKDALLWLLNHSNIKKDLAGQEIDAEIEGKIYKVKVIEKK